MGEKYSVVFSMHCKFRFQTEIHWGHLQAKRRDQTHLRCTLIKEPGGISGFRPCIKSLQGFDKHFKGKLSTTLVCMQNNTKYCVQLCLLVQNTFSKLLSFQYRVVVFSYVFQDGLFSRLSGLMPCVLTNRRDSL